VPIQPDNRNPSSRRRPGRLVRIKQLLPSPPKEGAPLKDVVEYIKKLPGFLSQIADNQDDLSRMLWFQTDSLPGKHGLTHMGGDDSIAGDGIVQPVGPPGTDGTRGDPHLGFSPHNHIHELDLGPLEDLLDLDGDPVYGTFVTDNKLRRLLEMVYLALLDLEAMFVNRKTKKTIVVALNPFSVTSSTSEQVLLDNKSDRSGFVIYNNSTAVLYAKYGTGVSTSVYTYVVQPGLHLESVIPYSGVITGLWASANGNAQITEMVEQAR
jgi:hypothetical protein